MYNHFNMKLHVPYYFKVIYKFYVVKFALELIFIHQYYSMFVSCIREYCHLCSCYLRPHFIPNLEGFW